MAQKAIVGEKVGMTQVWDEDNRVQPVTVLRVRPNRVVQVKTTERDGYSALQVTVGHRDAEKLTRPEAGHFAAGGVEAGERLVELRLDDVAGYEVGQEITVESLADQGHVDVTSVSKGKGFAGAMKRWGFGGMRASHGVSITHRAHGSTGQRQDPGKVFKNKKMAGHMGDRQRTQQNLEIVRTDVARGLIFVKGSVPGAKNGWLLVRDAVKVPTPEAAPFPGSLKNDNEAPVAEEVIINAEVEVADTPAVEAEAPSIEVPAEAAPAVEAVAVEAPAADAGEEKKEG